MQKARGQAFSPEEDQDPPTACRHEVSGSVSPASRRAFHLSLTVLVHYRSQERISPWQMVLPASIGISRVPTYSGTTPRRQIELRLRDSHPLRWRLPTRFGSLNSAIRRACRPLRYGPTTPWGQRLQPVTPPQFGLLPFRSPLLRESLVVSSSSGYLDVSVPRVRLPQPMYSAMG